MIKRKGKGEENGIRKTVGRFEKLVYERSYKKMVGGCLNGGNRENQEGGKIMKGEVDDVEITKRANVEGLNRTGCLFRNENEYKQSSRVYERF